MIPISPLQTNPAAIYGLPQPPPPQIATATTTHNRPEMGFADNADFDIMAESESEFPLDCLPNVMCQMAEETARITLTPESLGAACCLGALSASLGAGLEVETSIGILRGNLFITAVADSGTGKGVTFDKITKAFRDSEYSQLDEWRTNALPELVAETKLLERQIKALGKSTKVSGQVDPEALNRFKLMEQRLAELENLRVEPLRSVDNVTSEALAIALSRGKHEALASMTSEARGVIDVLAGKYTTKTDECIYLGGFSGDPFKYDRVNRPTIHLRHPCLSLLWLVQPDKFNELLTNSSLADSGLLPRMLMFDSHATFQAEPEHRHPFNTQVNNNWDQLIASLLRNIHDAAAPVRVDVTLEAAQLLRQYRNEFVKPLQPGGPLHDVSTFVARWAEHAWRMCLVLHAGMHGEQAKAQPITGEIACKAIKLIRWFAAQQLKMLSVGRHEKKQKRIDALISVLCQKPDGFCTLRDMERRHGFTKQEVTSMAAGNQDKFTIAKAEAYGPGRPSEVVKLVTQP